MTQHDRNGNTSRSTFSLTRNLGAPMSRVIKSFAILLVLGCWTASSAYAVPVAQMLDDFDVPQGPFATSGGIGSTAGSTVAGGSIAGGFRSAFIQKQSGSGNPNLKLEGVVDTFGGASSFNISRSSGIGGVAQLQWDGENTPPTADTPTSGLIPSIAPPLDLTTGGSVGIVVRVLDADVAGQQITFDLYGATSGDRISQTVLIPVAVDAMNSPYDVLLPWASFNTISGSVNLNSIQAFALRMDGPAGADITLEYVATYVPEPASAGMLGLGMVFLAGRMRKRSRVRAAV
jgi:hypothetical protein